MVTPKEPSHQTLQLTFQSDSTRCRIVRVNQFLPQTTTQAFEEMTEELVGLRLLDTQAHTVTLTHCSKADIIKKITENLIQV